jgi:hypothetical protein
MTGRTLLWAGNALLLQGAARARCGVARVGACGTTSLRTATRERGGESRKRARERGKKRESRPIEAGLRFQAVFKEKEERGGISREGRPQGELLSARAAAARAWQRVAGVQRVLILGCIIHQPGNKMMREGVWAVQAAARATADEGARTGRAGGPAHAPVIMNRVEGGCQGVPRGG